MPDPIPDSPSQDFTPPYFWGIDIGGTGIKCGLVDHDGKTVAFEAIATEEASGPQAAVDRIAATIQRHEIAAGVQGRVPRIGMGLRGRWISSKGRSSRRLNCRPGGNFRFAMPWPRRLADRFHS